MANYTIANLDSISTINDADSFIIYKVGDINNNETPKCTKRITNENLKPYFKQELINNFIESGEIDDSDIITNIYLYVQDDESNNLSIKKIDKNTFTSDIISTTTINTEIINYLQNNQIQVPINPESYLSKGTKLIPVEETTNINLNDYINNDDLGRYYYDYNQNITLINKPSHLNSTINFNMIVEQLTDSIIRQTIRPYDSSAYYARDIKQEYWIAADVTEGFTPGTTYYEQVDSNQYRNIVNGPLTTKDIETGLCTYSSSQRSYPGSIAVNNYLYTWIACPQGGEYHPYTTDNLNSLNTTPGGTYQWSSNWIKNIDPGTYNMQFKINITSRSFPLMTIVFNYQISDDSNHSFYLIPNFNTDQYQLDILIDPQETITNYFLHILWDTEGDLTFTRGETNNNTVDGFSISAIHFLNSALTVENAFYKPSSISANSFYSDQLFVQGAGFTETYDSSPQDKTYYIASTEKGTKENDVIDYKIESWQQVFPT